MKLKRIACWALLCALLLALAAPALARTVPDGTVVYVTDTGECYHRKGCSYLKSSNRTTVERAEARGYRPCSRCDPDVLTGEYGSQSGSSGSSGSSKRTMEAKTSTQETKEKREENSVVELVIAVGLVFLFSPFGFGILISMFEFLGEMVTDVRSWWKRR